MEEERSEKKKQQRARAGRKTRRIQYKINGEKPLPENAKIFHLFSAELLCEFFRSFFFAGWFILSLRSWLPMLARSEREEKHYQVEKSVFHIMYFFSFIHYFPSFCPKHIKLLFFFSCISLVWLVRLPSQLPFFARDVVFSLLFCDCYLLSCISLSHLNSHVQIQHLRSSIRCFCCSAKSGKSVRDAQIYV